MRLVMFAAMAALLVMALCVPGAFGAQALEFAVAYAFVRIAHIALFALASRDDPQLRRSVTASRSARRSASASSRSPRRPTASCRRPCGCWRSRSTWQGRCCSAWRAGGSSRTTSPSATG